MERKIRGDLMALYNYLKQDCSEVRVGLFCHISNERMRRNGLKLGQGTFRSDIRRKIITERVVIRTGIRSSGSWWSHDPWKCSRGIWMWNLGCGLWLGMVVLCWWWGWMILKVFLSFDDPAIYSFQGN